MKAKFIYEKLDFERGGDPLRQMDIGMFHFNVEFSGDIEDMGEDEKRKAKNWQYKNIRILTVDGTADEDTSELDIRLSDGDYIFFESYFETGPSRPVHKDYANILIQSEGKNYIKVFEEFNEEISEGSIILAVMKIYVDIKEGKILKESLDFTREGTPFEKIGIGSIAMAEKFKEYIEDKLSWNGARITIMNRGTAFKYECYPGQSIRRELLQAVDDFGWGGKFKLQVIDNSSRGEPDGSSYHVYLLSRKKARKISEAIDFTKQENPLDSLAVGRVAERQFEKDKIRVKEYIQDIYEKFGDKKHQIEISKDFVKVFRVEFLSERGNICGIEIMKNPENEFPNIAFVYPFDGSERTKYAKSIDGVEGVLTKFDTLFIMEESKPKPTNEAQEFTREGTPIEKMGIGSEDLRMISKMDHYAKEYGFEKSGLSGTEYIPEDPDYMPLQKWVGPKGQWIVLEKQRDDRHTLKYWVSFKGWEYGKDTGLARGFTDDNRNWEKYFGYPLDKPLR